MIGETKYLITALHGTHFLQNLPVLIKELDGQADYLIVSYNSLILICNFSSVFIRAIGRYKDILKFDF